MGLQDLLDRARFTETPELPETIDVPDDASAIDDILPPDPKPGKEKRSRVRPPRQTPMKATAAQKRQVEDSIEMVLSLMGAGVSFRDGVCGPAITAQAKAAAKAAAPIICRNPAWLAWFVGGTGFLDAMALIGAVWPVLTTVWGHHVTGAVGHEHEEGAGVDYSAYAAPAI